MFAISLVIAIIIGYVLKGRIGNLAYLRLKYVWLIIIGFLLERGINYLLSKQIWKLGALTYGLDLLMYVFIFGFVILNKQSREIIVMGVGFLLNAIVIFANGGAMPVGNKALEWLGYVGDLAEKGLYQVMNESTRFKLLADIMPIRLEKIAFIISLGDIVLCLGLMILIIKGMRKQEI